MEIKGKSNGTFAIEKGETAGKNKNWVNAKSEHILT